MKQGKVLREDAIWSEIKPVFTAIQSQKCAYCETLLEGAGSSDIEHFRPKHAVGEWPGKADRCSVTHLKFGGATAKGYLRLAFDPRNYCVACKTCNTKYKKNRFPVQKARRLNSSHPSVLRKEKAWLINPLSHGDVDPRSVIRFRGCTPVAYGRTRQQRDRGQFLIEFFDLDNGGGREPLFVARALTIASLFLILQGIRRRSEKARTALRRFLRTPEMMPHASCALDFIALADRDWDDARAIAEAAAVTAATRGRR